MANLLTTGEIASIKKDLVDVFDTFSNNRDIVVWKEPTKVPLTSPQMPQQGFGFGDGQVDQQYTYIPVSGVFKAVIRYASTRHIGESRVLNDTNVFMPIGEVKIKVTPECYSFIENGQTDKISFDNKDWYFAGKAQAAPFMGTLYYFYQLNPKV